jgi:hypothetical protein
MKNTADVELTKIREDNPVAYMVKLNGQPIGFLEKYTNTRTETHPWKAFGVKLVAGNYQYAPERAFKCFYGANAKQDAVNFLKVVVS